MGKGKNKGYDLAKRQEKILKRMAKPLYKKPDSSTYFVVTQPFGMHPSPAARGNVDINRLTSWISWVFRRESVVEAVYTMSTKDEIIVRVAQGLNPTRMLGKHKYKGILNAGWPYDPSPASCVYIYDYQSSGDPSNHNWREHVPSEVDTPPDYFRHPYPAPTWTQRPSHLAGLALALPDSLPQSPEPSPEPSSEAPSHTRKEGVKPEPSHSFHNTDNAVSQSSASTSQVKIEKSNPTDPSIALGESAYEPTQALRDQIALLNASRSQASVHDKQGPVPRIKHEPSDSNPTRFRIETHDAAEAGIGVKPEPEGDQDLASVAGSSQALWDEWARYQSNQRQPDEPVTRMKQESCIPQSTAQIPIAQSPGTEGLFNFVPPGPLSSFAKNKRELGAGEGDVQPWKRPKTEIN